MTSRLSLTEARKRKSMLAYEAHDGDEGWAVVFARSGAEARRKAANEMDCDFEGVDFCRRRRQFDQYAALGHVPLSALIDYGWWQECHGCTVRIDSDCYDYENDTELDPIFPTDHSAYCSLECYRRAKERKADDDALTAATRAKLIRAIFVRFPDVILGESYVYVSHGELRSADMGFSFPGGTNEARFDLLKPGFVNVTVCDLNAWERYFSSLTAHLKDWENEGGAVRAEAA